MSEFNEYQIRYFHNSMLFNTEMECAIIKHCNENDLVLPENFNRNDYKFFQQPNPYGIDYIFLFQAREKTKEENLRDQIEFQIQQLEK